jgi:sulfonate transport system ATP-binding protein
VSASPDVAEDATATYAVEALGVRRIFNGRAVLDGVNLQLKKGDFVALLGPSGTGKTTLLRIIGGLDTADEGHVVVPRVRSTVFQEPRLVPAQKVWRNVVLGARSPRAARRKALDALTEVGIERQAKAWPRTLSGGEAQRVALARALVTEPACVLADEPTGNLDRHTAEGMLDLMLELNRELSTSFVVVTHDPAIAARMQRTLRLEDGKLRQDPAS